ncbi:MAG TPA: ATP-grasp domain-containing protein [Pyrinomonadaceae bacterium]|jgi:hypothetical protein|nr:ATP-grasp domain-containing protein [Pyrinomonadaceae bacterium]
MTSPKFANPVRSLFEGLVPAEERGSARFLWLSNFEAERFWAPPGAVQLPKISQGDDVAVVNRLEEKSLFLAEYPDTLILREPSDEGFLAYLAGLGFRPPRVLNVNAADRQTPISAAVLADEELCAQISKLAREENLYLLPFGKTRLEEEIAAKTGVKTLGPPAGVVEYVNSKIYSRRVSSELRLKTIPGCEAESPEELEEGFAGLKPHLDAGRRLVLKEAMGVSGKGLVVIDNEAKFRQLTTLLKRRAKPGASYDFVLEVWIDKERDINYQIFISADGEVRLLALKEIATLNGVHQGHRFPPELSAAQTDAYEQAAQALGRRLFADGFTGIVGLDSIIDREGEVYPALEINARFNMSTYQLGLERLIGPSAKVVAKYYPLVLAEPVSFAQVRDALGDQLFDPKGNGSGVLIQNFATVNVNAKKAEGETFKGRLYALVVGHSFDETERIDRAVTERLATLQAEAAAPVA